MASNASPSQVTDLLRRGMKFQEKGKFANALKAFDDAIAADPGNPEAYCRRGDVFADQGMPDLALANYERAIALAPGSPDPYDLRGIVLAQSGRIAEALPSFERALTLDPRHLNALYNRAFALKALDRLEEALRAYDQVIEAEPGLASAHHDRGHTLAELGRHRDALASFDQAIRLNPQDANVHCNRATALEKLGDLDAAIHACRHALHIDGHHAGALGNLASMLAKQGEREEASELYRRVTRQQPDDRETWSALGAILEQQRKFDEAGRCYQEILKRDLNNVGAIDGLGRCLENLDQPIEALACYDHWILIAPDEALAHYRRGVRLRLLGRYAEALSSFDRVLELDASLPNVHSERMHAAMFLADWQDFDQRLADLSGRVGTDAEEVSPFVLLGLTDDGLLQLQCARAFATRHHGSVTPHPFSQKYPRHERIRIGYFSADFFHHATLQLFMETLEAHDRERFELIAFVFGRPRRDASSARAEAAFDRMVDVRFVPDHEAAAIARDMAIDIAVDLKGFTAEARTGIFAHRAAPVQVSYLGYPGTLGLPTMDYIFADEVLIPPECRPFYSEKIVYLPGSYQPNDAIKPYPATVVRSDLGLPADAFVYCCFNRNYKITPAIFDIWMRLLNRASNAVLWLWVENADAQRNLRQATVQRGVNEDRLIFAGGVPLEQHLARLKLADLFLDTFPCNAHTTASDALKAGLPIVTCPGQAFASRGAASLLSAVDLHEMIVPDLRSYEVLAEQLAKDRARLAAIRATLAANLTTSSLFDPDASARKLESAYRAIHERYQADLPPADVRI